MEKIKNASELAKVLKVVGEVIINFNRVVPIEYRNTFLGLTIYYEIKGIKIIESPKGQTVCDVFSDKDKMVLRFNRLTIKNKEKVVEEILKNINNIVE
jgi:hypothetical protein